MPRKAKRKIKRDKAIKDELQILIEPKTIPKEIIDILKDEIKKVIKRMPERYNKRQGNTLYYKTSLCFKAIDLFAEGKDNLTIATELGVTYNTFCRWRKSYEEFNYTCKIGRQLCYRYWIELGRENLLSRDFNHILWMMNMTNRFRWLTSNGKEVKRIKKTEDKTLEIKFDDDRVARIVNLASTNKTIVDSGKIIDDQSEIYQDSSK
jgi:hypothetical protein